MYLTVLCHKFLLAASQDDASQAYNHYRDRYDARLVGKELQWAHRKDS
jgi:hypothetical protein